MPNLGKLIGTLVPVADFAGTAFASGLEWPARHISDVECFPLAAAELEPPEDDHLQKKNFEIVPLFCADPRRPEPLRGAADRPAAI